MLVLTREVAIVLVTQRVTCDGYMIKPAATCAGNVLCKTFFKYYKIYFQDRVMLLEAKCSQIVYIVYVCQLSGILVFRIKFKCDLCHPMEYIEIPFVELCAVTMCNSL